MEQGKKICNALKEVRKRITDALGIPYEMDECHHKGECMGTCPKCDEETKYIQEQLDEREKCGLSTNIDNMIANEELKEIGIQMKSAQRHIIDDRDTILMGQCMPPDYYKFPSKIMKTLLKGNKYGNIVFSPIGIAYILAMLQNGMEIEDEYIKIEELIGMFPYETSNQKKKGFRLSHALSLWNNKEQILKDAYIKEVKDRYSADVYSADFSNRADMTNKINKWVERQTYGMIKTIDTRVSPATTMLLIDALYMKAEWVKPFDGELTKRKPFFNADGSKSMVDMMFQCLSNPCYLDTDEYQAIQLPYCGGRYGMAIVKPKPGVRLDTVMTQNIEKWTDIRKCVSVNTDVDFYMPCVKMESDLQLTDTLKAMGLKDLFKRYDLFPHISDATVVLSDIFQRCTIDINEEGTEAAAITHCVYLGCLHSNEIRKHYIMKLDSPFGFAIVDAFGKPLFMGVIKTLPDKGKEKKRKSNK